MEKRFLSAFHYGKNIHRLNTQYKFAQQKANTLQIDIQNTESARHNLKNQIHEIKSKQHQAKHTLMNLNRTAHHAHHDLKRTHNYTLKRRLFSTHNHAELAAITRLTNRFKNEYKMQLNKHKRHHPKQRRHNKDNQSLVAQFIKLEIHRGKLESQLTWTKFRPVNSNRSHGNKNHHGHQSKYITSIQQRLRTIRQQLRSLKLQRYGVQHRHARLIGKLARSQGQLIHHNTILNRSKQPHILPALIRMHFQSESTRVTNRIHFQRYQNSAQFSRKRLRILRRAIRKSRIKQNNMQRTLHHLQSDLGKIAVKINRLKANNPHR